ncbi:DoxX family protein [Dolichospermum sp. UHCC 0259]|uniref:DoxX family protein n=1 Tax=Dolichospermum sp. UHCC 0259 TaxID=2590010 RepID=UPI001ECF2EF1|nr:DoxX family protein [Dolichospermum sp. UHCC 0259]MTJ46742.1 DoxX family protein [Dolichospermum sp. UHCC 0259]
MQLDFITQFLPPYISGFPAFGILILRLIWGSAMVLYGWTKVKNPFNWMKEEGMPEFPGVLQLLGAITIFGGGIAIIAGFLTPLAALGIAGSMGIALSIHWTIFHDPFVKYPPNKPGPSFDVPFVYFAIALMLVFLGPGRLSIDYLLFG